MEIEITDVYLEKTGKLFRYYKKLGEQAIEQLEEVQLFAAFNENSNSIAVIVKHLWGNMLSRWTDFFTSDGEKEWRNRDAEFENDIKSKEELMYKWNEGWNCLFIVFNSINNEDLLKKVYIRNEEHTVIEAINRQLAHYAYHVGQIIFAAKILKKTEWISLSVTKNKSKEYNAKKM
jgi:hypothetical protein